MDDSILIHTSNKNFAAHLKNLKMIPYVPASMKNISMAGKTEDVSVISAKALTTGLQLIMSLKFFKTIYSLRTESERYNSRWKKLINERAYVKNINSVSNLNTVGHICLLTTADSNYL
jgi:hypothetical protein